MRLKDEKFYKTVRDFLDIYLIRHTRTQPT